jgi:type I restriction enzyme, S subunit
LKTGSFDFLARQIRCDFVKFELVCPRLGAMLCKTVVCDDEAASIAKWNNEEDVLVSPDYVVFRCDETRLDPDFLNHYRRSHRWTKFVEKAGDGSVRVRIWFSHLAELKLSLPPLPEQRRIAAGLNACDCELDLLREQLVEFKMQKQGLMQKLLTGQIRVNVNEAQAIGV